MSFDFLNALKQDELDYSTNGATMYSTSKSPLVDLNFKVSSLRNKTTLKQAWFDYFKALQEEPIYALKWLLYLRDIRQGIGERDAFISLLKDLLTKTDINSKDIIKGLQIAEYGRWKDLIDLYINIEQDTNISNDRKEDIEYSIVIAIAQQLIHDNTALSECKEISLLAKWMPAVKYNKKDYQIKTKLMKSLGFKDERDYKNFLRPLRQHLKLVEQYASANKWEEINYEAVPSQANLKYKNAFLKHDEERRRQYLESLKQGKVKINTNATFPYEIVSKYRAVYYNMLDKLDETVEAMWNNLKTVDNFNNTLVVRDGSGSMFTFLPSNSNCRSRYMVEDIADSLTLYCAQNNQGYFKDKFITFSSKPKIVDLSGADTLFDKMTALYKYDDCSNTNIEAVFNTILRTAKKNKLPQKDLPKNVLIISDMGFDYAMNAQSDDETLFDGIRDKFTKAGYELPKLIFWNVDAWNNAKIPMQENKNGLILLSGFSTNLMQMVCSSEINPQKALYEILNSDRYSIVNKVFPDVDELKKQLIKVN